MKEKSSLKLVAFAILFLLSFLFGAFLAQHRKTENSGVSAPASAAVSEGASAENSAANAQEKQ